MINEHNFHYDFYYKKECGLGRFARPNASLDGVGVALKVKVRQSNEDIASSRLGRRYSVCLSPCEQHLRHLTRLLGDSIPPLP